MRFAGDGVNSFQIAATQASKFLIGGGNCRSEEGNALVMSSQVYAHASERQSQSSDSGENLPSESESGLKSGSKSS
jgi:hypothetical protein